jgi:maltose O-acetyltransferase
MNAARLYVVHGLFALIPPTRFFAFKASLLRWAGAQVGRNVRVVSSARFHLSGDLAIGDGTWIGEDARIVGGTAAVNIGANVDVGPRVTLVTGTHVLWETTQRAAGSGYSSPIRIGDGVWIGACATVLGGVEVGACAMVAAGSLVERAVPSFTLVAGVPARTVRTLEVQPA